MSAHASDAAAIAEIEAAFARAGVAVSRSEILALVAAYRHVREGLDALAARLDAGTAPAASFDARDAR